MNVLFCENPFVNNHVVDADFEDEFAASVQNGFVTHLFSYESLIKDNDAEFATRRIKHSNTPQEIVYRGWMLKPNQYASLYDMLLTKNYKLINSPVEYRNCHYLPDSYRFIVGHTPKSIWMKIENQQVNYDHLFDDIATFKDSPVIVKDFVKSQKHYWDTACFISSASDKDKVKSVIKKFIQLQDTDLNEGLVIREFIELKDLATHSRSGMPLKQEYRLFFLNRQLLDYYDYWEEGEYSTNEKPPLILFENIGRKIESNFFSMDVAKTKKGEWVIIELGDGQVAGLPDKVERFKFYDLLRQKISS